MYVPAVHPVYYIHCSMILYIVIQRSLWKNSRSNWHYCKWITYVYVMPVLVYIFIYVCILLFDGKNIICYHFRTGVVKASLFMFFYLCGPYITSINTLSIVGFTSIRKCVKSIEIFKPRTEAPAKGQHTTGFLKLFLSAMSVCTCVCVHPWGY